MGIREVIRFSLHLLEIFFENQYFAPIIVTCLILDAYELQVMLHKGEQFLMEYINALLRRRTLLLIDVMYSMQQGLEMIC